MSVSLKALAAEVRKVWNPPGGRAWSRSDTAIVRLLRTIEEEPAGRTAAEVRAMFEAELKEEHSRVGQYRFDIADALAAFDRVGR